MLGLFSPKHHKKTTSHQYQKLYSTPRDMVHVPAKFRENTAMSCQVTVQKLSETDRQMDRRTGAFQYLLSRAFGAAGDKNSNV